MSNVLQVDADTGEILDDQPHRRDRENKDFVMLYRRFVQQLADLGMQDPQALRVLLFLIRHMDHRNAIVVPMTLIGEMLGITRQTASTKIKYLHDNGWIAVYKVGKSNVYTVNPEVVWTAYGDERKYAKFDATVMLSSTDQWETLDNKNNRVQLRHIDRGVLKMLADKEFPDGE